ncbi:GNAT family N-acetyltransferase [Shewanella sp. Isolate8]|uniref:GNAT family N-acetyltransferase n=1 Tax=Shewanella sp. Isolate8 TaxID=2908529 RepID=UPI001EFDA5DB|nr:GNAT family N-acetyltransferase [Shewanella sp. Isolate8]MCG9747642.1 GNAT family N-acetyltransferase [Shewanella sp. Isolate8]
MTIRLATGADLDALVELEAREWQAELTPGQRGALMTGQHFSRQELSELIQKHWLLLAEREGEIAGYVIAGHWSFFGEWPLYRSLVKRLETSRFEMDRFETASGIINKANSCQYGPIWIAPSQRGTGLFAELVAELKTRVAPQYPYMVTFIAEENERSFAAHTQKGGMQVLDFFEFDGRGYYLLAVDTAGAI